MQARDKWVRRWMIAVISCLLLLLFSIWMLQKNPFFVPDENVPESYFRWNAVAHLLTAVGLFGFALTSLHFVSWHVPNKRLYWSGIVLFGVSWLVHFGMFRETWADYSWSDSNGLELTVSGRRIFNKPIEWQLKPELDEVFSSGCVRHAEGSVTVIEMTLLPWAAPIDLGTDGMTFRQLVRKPCPDSKLQ